MSLFSPCPFPPHDHKTQTHTAISLQAITPTRNPLAMTMTRSHRPVGALLPRLPLARLLLLFFLVHPGSSATFESRHYLTQRYPNRDVIPPASLLPSPSQRRRHDTTPASLLFVRPPTVTSPMSSHSHNNNKGQAMPSSLVARPVVIGSFVSELESSNHDRRRNAGPRPRLPGQQVQQQDQVQHHQQQPQQHQQIVSSLPSSLATVSGGASPVPSASVGKLFKKSAASFVDAYDGVMSFVGSRIVTTEASFSKALLAVSSSMATPLTYLEGQKMPSLFSSSSSFSAPRSLRLSSRGGEGQLSTASGGGSLPGEMLSSSFSSPALVGFMDVDPFEKSKKHFKRNTSLAKLLL